MSLDLTKLSNIKRLPSGDLTAGCPQCMAEGHDSKRAHLFIHKTGAYKCVKDNSKDHSKAIWNLISGGDPEARYEYFDYKPKLSVDQIFPESSLSKLLPDPMYWIGRGINPQILPSFGGGIAAEDEKSKLSNRWVFPCRDFRGTLIGFAGRLLIESSFAPKWKIIGKKGRFIFPQPALAMASRPVKIILTEGVGDILALASNGVWNSLALFGLNISSEQIGYLISNDIREIIIATNNDGGPGNKAAEELKNRLSKFFNESNIKVHLPLAKDLLDMNQDQWTEWKASL